MLGVLVALPWELKTLTRRRLRPGTCSVIGDSITVALSGIGAERAHAAAALLFSRGATGLLSWGCAGALDDRLSAGSVILPACVIEDGGATYAVDPGWHREVYTPLSQRYPIQTGPVVETAGLIKSPAEKAKLGRRTGAIATDMESAAHARFAREHGLPFLALRAVLDNASIRLPPNVIDALDGDGGISVFSFLRTFGLRPLEWIVFVKLGLQFHAARKTLKGTGAMVLRGSRDYLSRTSPEMPVASRR